MHTLFLLLGWHALADFPLQGDFLANGKNRNLELGKIWWRIALPAHALIHGLGVCVITGSTLLGMVEFFAHGLIDFAKCEKWIGIEMDQLLHVACKVAYVAVLACFGKVLVG